MLFAVLEDLALDIVRGLHARAQHHVGLDLLHLVGVFDADDAAVQHLFVAVDDVLELRGIDVVAGGDDHALDALAEVDEAVLVHRAQVAGVQPDAAVGMLAQGHGRLLGVVYIAEHHRGAGKDDLALLAVGHLVGGAGLDDLVIGVREGHADGALAVVAQGRQAARRDALGGAVALADGHGGVVLL